MSWSQKAAAALAALLPGAELRRHLKEAPSLTATAGAAVAGAAVAGAAVAAAAVLAAIAACNAAAARASGL